MTEIVKDYEMRLLNAAASVPDNELIELQSRNDALASENAALNQLLEKAEKSSSKNKRK